MTFNWKTFFLTSTALWLQNGCPKARQQQFLCQEKKILPRNPHLISYWPEFHQMTESEAKEAKLANGLSCTPCLDLSQKESTLGGQYHFLSWKDLEGFSNHFISKEVQATDNTGLWGYGNLEKTQPFRPQQGKKLINPVRDRGLRISH